VPPWAPFPLSELLVLGGTVMIVWGLFDWEGGGQTRVGVGLAVAALGGLEVAVREHVAGYRSHTTLLAAITGLLCSSVVAATGLATRLWQLALVFALAMAGSFVPLQRLFVRRSGGLWFR